MEIKYFAGDDESQEHEMLKDENPSDAFESSQS